MRLPRLALALGVELLLPLGSLLLDAHAAVPALLVLEFGGDRALLQLLPFLLPPMLQNTVSESTCHSTRTKRDTKLADHHDSECWFTPGDDL